MADMTSITPITQEMHDFCVRLLEEKEELKGNSVLEFLAAAPVGGYIVLTPPELAIPKKKNFWNPYKVQVGQLWSDNDPRSYPRTVRVMEIDGDRAVVQVEIAARFAHNEGARTRVALKRFSPRSNGYRRIEE